ALRFRMSDRPSGKQGSAAGAGEKEKEKKGPSVWVLESGKPRRVPVKTGISDGANTEVLSGDLKEGQQLIVEMIRKSKSSAPSGPRMF
ncbi:MAG TPA: efflux RND transporter periplasmic adaptor subunit, partial [Nitrospirota bacterium]|nr:efflux RND transporter periplasmic adaptor subunit [Nitrospirota bacterium]